MRRLIIAEKPSVARDLARVLGATSKGDGCITSSHWVISWCFGHLAELVEPEQYDPAWKDWDIEGLPMIPPTFRLKASESGAEQFGKLAAWLTDPSIEGVVNACDAGREGELIFGYVYQLAGSRLPIERLWIASLTEEAIKAGMDNLKPGRAFEPLMAAARARNEADWLVGLNATRCVTLAARAANPGARVPLISVGRVQTPTLGLLASRTRERASFVPTPFFTLKASFAAADGSTYQGVLVEDEGATNAHRIPRKQEADALTARLPDGAHARVVVLERTEAKKGSPGFFDLTSLQQYANKRLGFSAKHTLDLAQALYESHKVLTYPRTDSKHITPDLAATLPARVVAAMKLPGLAALAGSLTPDTGELGKRLVNASKVTDHHAILPTDVDPTTARMSEDEAALYEIVARRLCAAISPAALVASTRVVTVADGLPFLTRGSQVLSPGWMTFEGPELKDENDESEDDDASIPPALEKAAAVTLKKARALPGKTKPPSALTEATLLGAMERAGASLEDAELRGAMKGSGLGTPATRADTIETLLRREYIERKGKSLVATELGLSVITALEAFPHLTSAQLTGRWESALSKVADGDMDSNAFMKKVREMTREVVSHFKAHPPRIEGAERETLGKCPACKTRDVLISEKGVWCSGLRAKECDFVLGRILAKKKLTKGQLTKLMDKRTLPEVKGFTSRAGKKFAAPLKLEKDQERGWRVSFDFPAREQEDFTGAPTVGSCPKCGENVLLGARTARCSNQDCNVRLWREVSGKVLGPEVFSALLTSRETEVISGFVSKKKTTFEARLKLEEDEERGWVFSFDFPEREQEDFTGAQTVGACPECGGKVLLGARTASCSNPACDVRLWRKVSGKVLEPEVFSALLTSRSTDELSGFVSKKKKRFDAPLKLEKDPKRGWIVSFDFPEREPGKKKGGR